MVFEIWGGDLLGSPGLLLVAGGLEVLTPTGAHGDSRAHLTVPGKKYLREILYTKRILCIFTFTSLYFTEKIIKISK